MTIYAVTQWKSQFWCAAGRPNQPTCTDCRSCSKWNDVSVRPGTATASAAAPPPAAPLPAAGSPAAAAAAGPPSAPRGCAAKAAPPGDGRPALPSAPLIATEVGCCSCPEWSSHPFARSAFATAAGSPGCADLSSWTQRALAITSRRTANTHVEAAEVRCGKWSPSQRFRASSAASGHVCCSSPGLMADVLKVREIAARQRQCHWPCIHDEQQARVASSVPDGSGQVEHRTM